MPSLPGPMRGAFAGALDLLPPTALRGKAARAQRFAGVAARGLPDAYRCWISFISEEDRNALLDGNRDDWGLEDYRAIWRGSEGAHPLDRLLDLNLRTYLVDDLLVKADRMSMAHALEVRSPFLDADLIAYTTRLPPRLKARGLSLKRVLKAAVEDLLPPEILKRGKRGFGVPLDRWFRQDLRAYVDSTLGAPDAHVRRQLVPEAVDRMLGEHASGRATTAMHSGRSSRSRSFFGARAGDTQPGRSAVILMASPRRVTFRKPFAAAFMAIPRRLADSDSLRA